MPLRTINLPKKRIISHYLFSLRFLFVGCVTALTFINRYYQAGKCRYAPLTYEENEKSLITSSLCALEGFFLLNNLPLKRVKYKYKPD